MSISGWLLLIQVFSTLSLVGLIWFVQVVHYPLFAYVGTREFTVYEARHQTRTTWVVAPFMLLELGTAIGLLWWRPGGISPAVVYAGAALVLFLWLSTFFWQVPAHRRLSESFEPAVHRRLVRSNWVRTAAWTVRGVLACWMCFPALFVGNVS